MSNVYVSANADDVGNKIGSHIAADDHEGLAATTSAINGAHGNLEQWVESVGGKKITSSGDEIIFVIPEQALGDLESIRGSYRESSGHSLTIGIGSSMSESAKALIYGKLNGKDQIVHYDPMIEDYLSDQDVSEDEMPEEVPMDSDEESDGMPEGMEDEESDGMPEGMPEGMEDEESDEEDGLPAESLESDDVENADENAEGPEALEDEESDEAMAPAINEESMESVEGEEDSEDPDAPGSMAIDGDVDGEDFGADKDGSDEEEMGDEAAQSPEMSDKEQEMPGMEEAPQDESVDGESVYQELGEDDKANPEMGDDSYNQDDALTDMIHGDMEDGSGDEMSEDGAPEEMGAEQGGSQLDEELRQDIASALMAFKENKDMLEQAREQNPKLYEATITMLRSMIEMAKKLGQNPEQDLQDQEGEQQLNEEFPAADDQEDDMPGPPPAQPPMQGEPAEKK